VQRRAFVLLLPIAVALAGCGGSHRPSHTLGAAGLAATVLQPADVPTFEQFVDGPQTRSDAHPGPRSDPTRFGRTGGWIARYRATSTPKRGPLVIESRTDVFGSGGDASKDLEAYRDEYAQQVGARTLPSPAVGDAAIADAFGAASDRFVLVAWTYGNATASVVVEGFSVRLRDALRLARDQQRRLEKAAG
jgi:hypothetical protein